VTGGANGSLPASWGIWVCKNYYIVIRILTVFTQGQLRYMKLRQSSSSLLRAAAAPCKSVKAPSSVSCQRVQVKPGGLTRPTPGFGRPLWLKTVISSSRFKIIIDYSTHCHYKP